MVCNPRKNARLKDVNNSDQIDARKLAQLLRGDHLGAFGDPYYPMDDLSDLAAVGRVFTALRASRQKMAGTTHQAA